MAILRLSIPRILPSQLYRATVTLYFVAGCRPDSVCVSEDCKDDTVEQTPGMVLCDCQKHTSNFIIILYFLLALFDQPTNNFF